MFVYASNKYGFIKKNLLTGMTCYSHFPLILIK